MSKTIETRFLCASCHHLLVKPKFASCGHRYCSRCLTKIINAQASTICPMENCHETINRNATYPDFAMENELKNFDDILCHNKVYGCSWQGSYVSYKVNREEDKISRNEHVDQCAFERFPCPFCSLLFDNRILYDQHISNCPKALISCPLRKFGCDTQVRREVLLEHVVSSSLEHLQFVADALSSMSNSNSSIESSKTSTHEKESTNQQIQIIEQLRLEQKSLQSLLIKREQDLMRTRVDLQLYKGELCQLRKEFELSQSLMSNDGIYLWRIDNVQQLVYNAKNSSQPISYTSPVFYTSRYGYKLALKVYLNGDKTVRNTHLSIYVMLMRGQYDSLLQWPFSYPVTLCLYDRSSHQDHVVHTLTPDLSSECFQQPRMDTNKSGGIPQFCPLCKVFNKEFGYVNENTMFIKAFIDFKIYPTKIWPTWTKLQSAGLPSHVEAIKMKNFIETPK